MLVAAVFGVGERREEIEERRENEYKSATKRSFSPPGACFFDVTPVSKAKIAGVLQLRET